MNASAMTGGKAPKIHHEPVEQTSSAYLKYKIAVSGAAVTDHCPEQSHQQSEEIGREIVRQGAVVVTGATTGIPYWAAKGAKEEGGISFGLSPAATEKEHVEDYKLPVDYFDMIVYTGFDYSGRNLMLMRSADAIIVMCGRIGTLNEFTIAFEDEKPIGILDTPESEGTTDLIKQIVEVAERGPGKIVYDSDPKKLIEKVIALIEEEKAVTRT